MPLPRGSAGRRLAEERLAERRRSPRRPAETPLVWIALATGAGALTAVALPHLGFGPPVLGATGAMLLMAWAHAWWRHADTRACGLLLASVASLAGAWAGAAWRWFPVDDVGRYAPRDAEPVCFEARVHRVPTVYPAEERSPFQAIPPRDRTVLDVEVVALRDGVRWRPTSGRCEVTIAGRLEALTPGERLRVFGQLRRPSPAMNPGQRDAAAMDRAERKLARVWTESPACVASLGNTSESPAAWLASTRVWSLDRIDAHLPPVVSPLARAMLLGEGSRLPEPVVKAFRKTGTLHVLVVSGLHVGLVAAVLPGLAALGLLPRRLAWCGALVLVIAYVALVGARPSAVRAGVVAAAACLAALSGWRALSLNSLAGAGVAVFATQPGAWAAAGTQLSFLAAATLLGVSSWIAHRNAKVTPPLERLVESTRTPIERLVRRGLAWAGWVLAATLAVQLVTGPLVASEFHRVSPAAAPLALVVSPLVALSVGSGLLLLAAESVGLSWIAEAAGWLCGVAVQSMGDSVVATSRFAGAGFWTAGPTGWWSAAWIASCGIGALLANYGVNARPFLLRSGVALAAAAFAPTLWSTWADADKLRCHFLAVGHGSATLIETPDGECVLIDAGALGSPDRVADTVARTLWAHGVTRIDAILLTHADIDHYNAIPGLIERFPVEAIWTTHRMFPRVIDDTDHSGPAELARLLKQANLPTRLLRRGDRLRVGAARLEVLHPDELGVLGSDNANSLVLGVEYAGRRLLLPGDLESPGIEALLAQEPYDCDLILAPHHGSHRSNPPGFAAWCRPERVVISSGQPRGEARSAYARAGAEVISTHETGEVSVSLSERGLEVNSFR
ncbi:ComEC family competence protein [Planctomycetes bacterium MalM25]|nr:ComEC family competence protein [Planctomycetes bacterium MalM25]